MNLQSLPFTLTGTNKAFSNIPLNKELNLNILRQLENGMYLINLRGENYKLPLKGEIEPGNYKGILKKNDNDEKVTLIIKNTESSDEKAKNTENTVLKNIVEKPSKLSDIIKFIDKVKIIEINSNKETNKTENLNQKETVIKLKLQFLKDFTKGNEVNVKIIKPTNAKNSFIVKINNAEVEIKIIPPPKPNIKEFIGEILQEFPDPVIKPINKEILTSDKINETINQDTKELIKNELLNLRKTSLSEIMKSTSKLTLNEFTPKSIENVVKESGNFFENKLLNNLSVNEDLKFDAIKNDNAILKETIVKLQLFNSILNDGVFSFFNFEDNGLKSGEMQIKKENDKFTVHIKMDFSQIGETFIKVVSFKGKTDVVVSSEKDISKQIKKINLPGINVHWKQISSTDKEEFNIEKKIMTSFSGLNILI